MAHTKEDTAIRAAMESLIENGLAWGTLCVFNLIIGLRKSPRETRPVIGSETASHRT